MFDKNKKEWHTIGVMSGTSLDALDIAYVIFYFENNKWKYDCKKAFAYKIPNKTLKLFHQALKGSSKDLLEFHYHFGRLIAEKVNYFISKNNIAPDFIASHGQTIFHNPSKSYTFQAGCGGTIAALTGITTISDFRSTDISLGGQGAPLVPIGDELLFGEYDYCLNLGGFANISFKHNSKRVAFDICPNNVVLNYLAKKLGKNFDKNGKIASSGKIIKSLLNNLNKIDYYKKPFPKSLGWEWVEENMLILLDENKNKINDLLRTFVEHISFTIANVINTYSGTSILITGGGAHNEFLINRIKDQLHKSKTLIIPSKHIIDFKEAIIFAFLGLLRILEKPNCLASVTGAIADNIGGAIYCGKKYTN